MSPWKVITILLLLCFPIRASEFLRVVETDHGSSLQTAVTTYLHPSGVRVVLFSVVHVGDKDYYRTIADQIRPADALVYEGIIRKIGLIDLTEQWFTPLGLVAQQSVLRFHSDNIIRGDLSAEEFDRIRKPFPMRAAPASKSHFANQLASAMVDPEELKNLEATCAITPRNSAAIKALQTRINRGDQHIAMLYGAAHGDDLEKRLLRDLGFRRQSQRWLKVFDF